MDGRISLVIAANKLRAAEAARWRYPPAYGPSGTSGIAVGKVTPLYVGGDSRPSTRT